MKCLIKMTAQYVSNVSKDSIRCSMIIPVFLHALLVLFKTNLQRNVWKYVPLSITQRDISTKTHISANFVRMYSQDVLSALTLDPMDLLSVKHVNQACSLPLTS